MLHPVAGCGAFVHGEKHHPSMHHRSLGRERRPMGLPTGDKFVQMRLNDVGLVQGHPSAGHVNPNPG